MIFGRIHDLSLETYTLKDKRNRLYTIPYYLSIIVYELNFLAFVITTTTTTTTDFSPVDSIVFSCFLKILLLLCYVYYSIVINYQCHSFYQSVSLSCQ